MSDSDDIEMLESSGTKKPSSEVAPPKKKSDIWEYFKLKEEDGKKMAVFTKCPRKSYTFSGWLNINSVEASQDCAFQFAHKADATASK